MKLASTRIVTKDVSTLARFYEDVIGVIPVGNEDFVEIRTSGSVLAICSERSVLKDNAAAARSASNRSVILEFEVDDVDAEYSRLQGVVGDWVMDPTTQPWGNRSMLLRDPDGNLINIYTAAGALAARASLPR
ncbi:VOC family protein [Sphingosinicellaceae bacterium]|nr:VOC family protein [Sphingosinicellaceae bacterium]